MSEPAELEHYFHANLPLLTFHGGPLDGITARVDIDHEHRTPLRCAGGWYVRDGANQDWDFCAALDPRRD